MEILQKTIEQIRKQYGLAGGILVAVKDGKVVLKECFGMADAEQNKSVDSKTLFQIASCSKAFTTMVAGQLCDEGKIQGVLSIGGAQGSAVSTAAMRELPVGFTKVMI